MNYYAVIDTNVLVSAVIKWDSVPGSIMEMVFDGPIIPVLNGEILDEYRNVLLRPKFKLTEEIVERILRGIKARCIYVDSDSIDIELPDPNDRVFYEVVMEKRKDDDAYLVTGNLKHFPERPYIVTPREMLDIIFNRIS